MLTDLQVTQRITKPSSQAALGRAAEDNDRQRFHALTATSKEDAGGYVSRFEKWIQGMLDNEEKFARFKQLMLYPVPTSRIVDKAADQYLKAFDAEDKFIDMEFSSESLKADAGEYLAKIEFDDFLNKTLFNQALQASAAIWIVDLQAEPNEYGYAEPEPVLREMSQLTDIGVNRKGEIQYVIFPLDSIKDANGAEVEKRWAVIDDESYRVFKKANGDSDASMLITNPHDLGYAPCGFIWHDKLIGASQPLRIQSPLHALLSDMDYYVAASVFRQHADLYSAFPILRSLRTQCNYQAPGDDGGMCNNGYVVVTKDDKQTVEKCPVCAKKKPIGPGTHIETPPTIGTDGPDYSNPVAFVGADRNLLDYNAEKLNVSEEDLIEALTGDDGTVDQSTGPVNQDQVQARFEKRKAILKYWAEQLERTHRAILQTMLALRYGSMFIDVSVSYGSEFHLLSPGQAIMDYDAARKAGLPTYQLMARRVRIDKLLAGSSESEVLRYYMLAQLEPYPDLALLSVPVGSDAWELKANFSQYIARFERENIGIEVFGKTQSMAQRISTIIQTLYTYVDEDKKRREVPVPDTGDSGKPVSK